MSEIYRAAFKHTLEIFDKGTGELVDSVTVFNRIPGAGIDFLMQAPFGDMPAISNFYCGLFKNNYMPSDSSSATDLPSVMGEFITYAESSRPIWQRQYSGGVMTNNSNKAVFTPTQDASVHGSFIISTSNKGGNNGLIISVARFPTVKALSSGMEAKLSTGLTYVPINTI